MMNINRRSRKGAWIEMSNAYVWYTRYDGRSRKGAWIEIPRGIIYTESEVRSLP